MKKRKTTSAVLAVIMLVAVLATSLSGCSLFGRGDINDLADELFPSLFTNDAMSANFFIEDPQTYLGITPTATLSQPSSAEDYKSNCNAMKMQATLMAATYRYSKMSNSEKELFDFLQDFFETQSKFADYYYLQDDYIGGYSGAQANLPVYLTEYKFRREQDVKDYITLCTQTTTVFPTWVTFEQARLDNGYGRMKFVLQYALKQCEGFTGVKIGEAAVDPNPTDPSYVQTENFVLTNALQKLNECSFLSGEQKQSYTTQITNAVNNNLIPSYIKLGIDIKGLMNNPDNQSKFASSGLAAYGDNGKNYYQVLFNYSTSTSDSVTTAYQKCLTSYNDTIKLIEAIRTSLSEKGVTDPESSIALMFNDDYANNWDIPSLQSTITTLKATLANNFPAMAESEGEVVLKIVDNSLADYYAPAAYFVSALDNKNSDEVIIINNWESTGYLSYDLLSHEGIPGHLYQYNYLKNKSDIKDVVKVLCPTAYKEGWATYAEHYVASLYGEKGSTENLLMQYQVKKVLAQGYLRVMADILVNYNGYGTDAIASWLEETGRISYYPYLLPTYEDDTDGDGKTETVRATKEKYANSLTANSILFPCNAATYYYGYMQVSEIITSLQNKGYSDIDAHKAFLDSPYSFEQIKSKYGI